MQATESLQIVPAVSPAQIEQVKGLLEEFMAWSLQSTRAIGQNADALAEFHYQTALELPGKYAPPDGCLLLALYGAQAAGCGALRRLNANMGEIGRMCVRPGLRGKKIGKALLETLLQEARRVGYSSLRLETATFMKEAQSLYHNAGFAVAEPYKEIPDDLKPLTIFMELNLTEESR